MLKNFLKTSIRILIRQRGYTIINLLGLSIGISASILILLFVVHETSYDHFHQEAKNIYRINIKGEFPGEVLNLATSMAPLGLAAQNEIKEVQKMTRLKMGVENVLISYKNKSFYENKIVFADTSLFDIFSFNLIKGNPQNVLSSPYSMVISEDIAKKYFGNSDPIGNILIWNNEDEYTVTGVMENIPSNSHLEFNILISFSTLYDNLDQNINNWGTLGSYNYVLLEKDAELDDINIKLAQIIEKHFGLEMKEYGIKLIPFLQPITKIHLHSKLMSEFKDTSSIKNIFIFSSIAFLILIIAAINFMNLSTARAKTRKTEIGIRKTLGAGKKLLVFQFLLEAVLLSLLSLLLAIFLTEMLLPVFNNLTGKNIIINYFKDWYYIVMIIVLAITVGVLSGSYPAFYMSNFNPVKALQRNLRIESKGLLRHFLVLGQFALSITLIISTLIIYKQLKFMQNNHLGFNKDNVVVIPLRSDALRKNARTIINELNKIEEVKQIAGSSFIISRNMNGQGYFPEGFEEAQIFMNNGIDFNYINTMQFELKAGRNFHPDSLSDTLAIIINETTAKKLGWAMPIGKIINMPVQNDTLYPYHIIGLVKDYHIESFHHKIPKIILHLDQRNFNYLSLRCTAENSEKTLKKIKRKWKDIDPARPFDYFYLNESYEKQYEADKQFGKLIMYFTILAIFIACLGLFGLSLFLINQRTKEIGIRKVLGSSTTGIALLLMKEYAKWVLYANFIAWPVSYYAITQWLENFEYKINIPVMPFILAGLIAFSISMATVGYQSVKASLINPINSLRYE